MQNADRRSGAFAVCILILHFEFMESHFFISLLERDAGDVP
jgi:hypothetical protein